MKNLLDVLESFFQRSSNPITKKAKTSGHLIAAGLSVALFFGLDYILLLPWNLQHRGFLIFIAFMIALWATLDQILTFSLNKWAIRSYGLAILVIVLMMGLSVTSFEWLRATAYRDQITIKEVRSFTADFETVTIDRIPVVDKQTAAQLGDKTIGTVAGLGSQYFVYPEYTLLNVKDQLYRVSLLDYRDIIKWLNNRDNGVPAYVLVNVTNPSDVTLQSLDQGMKYTQYAFFNENIIRHVRFNHRTAIFGGISFEIDDQMKPYWVVSVVAPEIGWFGGLSAKGVIIVDPVNGDSNYYEVGNIPLWVDRVQPSDIAWQQIDNWGYYVNGFFNTLFAQKDMIETTNGYNYVSIDNQVHVYSGLTSIGSDRSIVGFALINLKTKEATFYQVGGADEASAMSSAQGQVQHLNYRATFPVLLNIGNVPTYFISLKDQEGLVKMYSFVAVSNYDAVGVGESVTSAYQAYSTRLLDLNMDIDVDQVFNQQLFTLSKIYQVIIDGNTTLLFEVLESDQVFTLTLKDHMHALFLKEQDTVLIEYVNQDQPIISIESIQALSESTP